MAPRDHRIHLGRMGSPESSPQNHSSAKVCFSGPQKTYAGQNVDLGDPKSDPGLQHPPPGMKKQKMRAEKPCRTPPSKNQTEPYSASYGRKPFWGVPLKILVYARGDLRGKMHPDGLAGERLPRPGAGLRIPLNEITLGPVPRANRPQGPNCA